MLRSALRLAALVALPAAPHSAPSGGWSSYVERELERGAEVCCVEMARGAAALRRPPSLPARRGLPPLAGRLPLPPRPLPRSLPPLLLPPLLFRRTLEIKRIDLKNFNQLGHDLPEICFRGISF